MAVLLINAQGVILNESIRSKYQLKFPNIQEYKKPNAFSKQTDL